jgi:hypothetical protein
MVTTAVKQPDNINYLSPTGFRFVCTNLPETQFYCQTANIPGVSISEVPVATPHRQHWVAGDNLTYDEFSITMIVDEYMRNWQEIQQWIIGLGKPESFRQYARAKIAEKIKTNASLFILTGSKNPALRFDFFDVWPKTISSISMDITASEITYLTADISFQYNYYEMTRLNPSDK